MNYNEYAATKIMRWKRKPWNFTPHSKTPKDQREYHYVVKRPRNKLYDYGDAYLSHDPREGKDALHALWEPDTDRNQLATVLDAVPVSLLEWLDDLGVDEDLGDGVISNYSFWVACMKSPALALKAICEAHKAVTEKEGRPDAE